MGRTAIAATEAGLGGGRTGPSGAELPVGFARARRLEGTYVRGGVPGRGGGGMETQGVP